LRLTRSDAEQELARFEASPPPGVAAKLAGVPYCPEAAIAAIPTALGTAKQEIANPSCPAASLIGHVSNGVGSGQSPNYFNGNVYLAGPYKGAPISGVAVVPGIAGPYDLGNVVVRAPAYFDPATARIKVKSDEIPKIFHGVLLRVRDVRVNLDREGFTNNPTSCAPTSIEALVNGVGADLFSTEDDAQASLSVPFQADNCARLGFKPRLFLRLYGRNFHRSSNPRLRAVLVPRAGDANVSRSAVTMPSSLFLDQDHIRTICTRAQFATDSCPAASIYGQAAAKSPLLEDPLRGKVYLRSSDNPLPDLVADLQGQVNVEVASRTDSVKGALRSTFDVVPDAPVSKFVLLLQPGQKSLLVASRNLCAGPQRARVNLRAHNGRRLLMRPKIRIPCKKAGRRGKRARRRAARRAARRASLASARAVR
jgi:hypothetical protein